MQMVAASKMTKAVQAATASRAYSDLAWRLVSEIAGATPFRHPLLAKREAGRQLVIILTSNRGLAGSYNAQVLRSALNTPTDDTDIATVGRKGLAYIRRFRPDQLVADFEATDSLPRASDIRPITSFAIQEFTKGTYHRVLLAYNKFQSTLSQVATIEQLLPVVPPVRESPEQTEYRIEPDPATVLTALLERVVPSRFYQLALDAAASEHSARMLAMQNATENAGEIVDELTLTYQSVRQANITREIIEISSGAAALAT